MTINQRIKEVRQTLKLSQARFAKEILISNGYIAGIELGNRNVNDRIIKLVCVTFHVREEWLRTGVGEMFEQGDAGTAGQVMRIFQELRPEFQQYVLEQITRLLELQRETDGR